MHCTACGAAMEARDNFCVACGSPARRIDCVDCGEPNRSGAAFCAGCGAALRITPSASEEESPGELKFVTLLRVDLVRSTDLVGELDPEKALARLEPALARMRAEVRRFDGQVSKELGDGLVAVFGAPLADGNHAQLACHSAIAIVERIAELNDPMIQVRIGLHSGHVVAHFVMTGVSKVYELAGAAQYLVERLQAAARPGQIYVSEACQRLAQGHIRFESVGAIALKGFSTPILAHRVVGIGETSTWRVRSARDVTRFVGRHMESATLERIAGEIGERGELVSLVGDPGIGKSRLAHEFIVHLKASGWRVFEMACGPTTHRAPFAALKSVLGILLGPDGAARVSGIADPRSGLSRLWNLALDAALDLPVTDSTWTQLEPALRGRAIAEATCAIVENLLRASRVALVVEDIQWIDSASDPTIEAVASLTRRLALLMLVTCRPDAEPAWLGRRNAVRLLLRPLDDRAGHAMLEAIVGPSPLVSELRQRILRHTGNVPLFIEEVCRWLAEKGALRQTDGSLTVGDPAPELGIPPTLQGLIATRIDRLGRDDRALLQLAAAVGPRSSASFLRAAAAMTETRLNSGLATLDRTELLIEVSLLPEHCFEFPHELVRQVAYQAMLEATREKLHQRILDALERLTENDSRDQSDTLCHHAVSAKNWTKAVAYARSVARKCVARSALHDATSYFEIAMDALDKTPPSRAREAEAIDLRIESRLAFSGFGLVDRWFDLAKEADRRAESIGDAGRRVAAMAVRAGALNFYGAPLEAIEAGEDVLKRAESLGDPGWLSFAECGLGQAYFVAGRCRPAERMLGRARASLTGPAAAAPLGTTVRGMLLTCCMMKSMSHAMLGEQSEAEALLRETQNLAAESNRPLDRVAAAYTLGFLLLQRGEIWRAMLAFDESLALAKEHEVRLFVPLIGCYRGIAYFENGSLEQSRTMLLEACQYAQALGYNSIVLRTKIYLSQVLAFNSPDMKDAWEMLNDVGNATRQQGYESLEAQALFFKAKTLASQSSSSISSIVKLLREGIEIATKIEALHLRNSISSFLNQYTLDEHRL